MLQKCGVCSGGLPQTRIPEEVTSFGDVKGSYLRVKGNEGGDCWDRREELLFVPDLRTGLVFEPELRALPSFRAVCAQFQECLCPV